MRKFVYPISKKSNQVDDYHGTRVSDPYRWLEDTDAPDTMEWIANQNQLTFSYLEEIPSRKKIRQRLTELWDYAKVSAPLKRGSYYFQLRNTGLQNQDVLFCMDDFTAEGQLLLDPNMLSEDGTVALTDWKVSKGGKLLAYAISASGSDWLNWRIRHVVDGRDLPDVIEWSKFSTAAWLPDESGFFYARYDKPAEGETYEGVNYYQKLCLHKIGKEQSQDKLIYHRPDQKEWGFDPIVSHDGRYLIILVWQGTDVRNRLFYQDLRDQGEIVELIGDLEANYQFVGNDGSKIYLRTDKESPRGRLIAIDLREPQSQNWETLIPQSEDMLESVKIVHDQFIAIYLHDAYHKIKRFDLSGNYLGEIELPEMGSILEINGVLNLFGNREDDELFYSFQSFVKPPTVYRYDFKSHSSEVIFSPQIHFDFSPYETNQVFVTSKDGTQIPLFLIQNKNLKPNGNLPTLLYGYGGFNIALTPIFSISRLIWLEMGGLLAIACLRGGGEYGKEWHQAGMLGNKQNVFDDFIACSEYLISENFSSSTRLAIQGGSNGGLLVGACMTQRPDLYAAALPAVGVMDMLRFQKFTIGWAWTSDYGSADDAEQFKILYAYSPLHNIKSGVKYPATFITTADHDDRVVPGHSFKFTATLQDAQSGNAPILIRIQTKAGHGFGKPTSILIDEQTDIWAFLVKILAMDPENATQKEERS